MDGGAPRTGLFGGCFNPVHHGHLAAARAARDHLGLDELLFIPTRAPPLRKVAQLAAGHHRIAMIERALADEPRMSVSAIEIEREGLSFTVETVETLRDQRGAHGQWYFLLGADCLHRLPGWKGIDTLHAMLRFAILPRGERPVVTLEDVRLLAIPMERQAISSTMVREAVANGRPLQSYVKPVVAAYILTHGLYKKDARDIGNDE